MKKLMQLILILFVVFLLVACGSNDSNQADGADEGDSPSGTLTVYSAFNEDHAIAAMERFQEETGINVDMVRLSAGEILAKVRAEKDNPQADIWFGGPADTFEAAKTEDLLHSYHSEVAEDISEEYKDPEGDWTGIYVGAIGFATNQNFLDENNLEAPTSWDDLLDPAYNNEIVMAHPSSSGTAYTALYSTLRAKGGDEEGFAYLEELHPQIQQYTTSGSAPGRMVGLNEVGAGILFAHDIIKFQQEGFDDIVLSFPEEGTGFEVGAVAIIEGAPNEELAQEFIDWAAGVSAQEVGHEANSFQSLTHPDATPPEGTPDLDEINLIDSDPKEAGERRQEILDRWDNEVNN
ncbi:MULTISPECIES: ABC transporter substrate-binding protein [Oceanobacillus]|uniref:Iron uptake protein A1 n=2 Tax=Oceanobacillus TaxID=182709 RepID=A0A0A1M9R7_9BACI|nr:ABC transporter substrate-binding protein [Oceanobacillus oncorhynchi]MDM8100095.1 ABC transporter substrate-binding protein [Oceanobacillus oncorhynchi]CEI82085.1 Iron uptake protein A1 precursor [Oceanobacillus oncorhynchi]